MWREVARATATTDLIDLGRFWVGGTLFCLFGPSVKGIGVRSRKESVGRSLSMASPGQAVPPDIVDNTSIDNTSPSEVPSVGGPPLHTRGMALYSFYLVETAKTGHAGVVCAFTDLCERAE